MPDINSLDSNRTDKNVAFIKAAISSLLPGAAGNLLSEIVGTLIPNQQMDRVVDFIKELNNTVEENSKKIKNIEELLSKIYSTKANLLLFEQAIRYSAQTESLIKHHSYAYFIFNLIEKKEYEEVEKEYILKTISELNEIEIILIIALENIDLILDESLFYDKYGKFIQRKSDCGSQEEKDFNSLQDAYFCDLVIKGIAVGTGAGEGIHNYGITSFGAIIYNAIYDEKFFNGKFEK